MKLAENVGMHARVPYVPEGDYPVVPEFASGFPADTQPRMTDADNRRHPVGDGNSRQALIMFILPKAFPLHLGRLALSALFAICSAATISGCYDRQIECDTSADCVADTRFGEGHICSFRHCIPSDCTGSECVESNTCGGSTALDNEPGQACGECGDGFFACTGADSVECLWAGEDNDCEGCSTLTQETGSACGPCGDGALACDALSGQHICVDATAVNNCGGCATLEGLPQQPCTDSLGAEGLWECISVDEVSCEQAGANPCGGGDALDVAIGSPCGTCTLGRWTCDPTTGGARCDESGVIANECGGCAPLAGSPGEACGACGTWRCDDSGSDRVVCIDRPNACGGCDPLQGAPGIPCGDGNITFCADENTLGCAPPPVNACGGSADLATVVGTACGACGGGTRLCAGPNTLVCVGDQRENACGGCELLIDEEDRRCAPGHRWACDDEVGNVRCVPIVEAACDQVVACVDGDGCCPDQCAGADAECVPSRPMGVSASDGATTDRVRVNWAAASGAERYALLRDGVLVSEYAVAPYEDSEAAAGSLTWTVAGATSNHGFVTLAVEGAQATVGETHAYKVAAINHAGISVVSESDTGFRGVGPLEVRWEVAESPDGPWTEVSGFGGEASHLPDTPGPWFYRARLSAEGAAMQTTEVIQATMFTCDDGQFNGDEEGVDCGGPCDTVCDQVAFADPQTPDEVIRAVPWSWTPAFSAPNGSAPLFAIESGPDGLSIDESTGALSWETTSWDLGEHTVVLSMSDTVGASSDQLILQLVVRDARIVNVEANYAHVCAVDELGRVFCWGDPLLYSQYNTQLLDRYGLPTFRDLLGCTPEAYFGAATPAGGCGALDLPEVMQDIAVGAAHTCGLTQSGTVYCWGGNAHGQLGLGDTEQRNPGASLQPVPISAGAVEITAGALHTCARYGDNRVECWGANAPVLSSQRQFQGLLGIASSEASIGDNETPGPSSTLQFSFDIETIDAGENVTCVGGTGGELVCWGSSDTGVLGAGTTAVIGASQRADVVTPIELGARVTSLDVGMTRACVTLSDNTVRCWGSAGEDSFGGASTIDILSADSAAIIDVGADAAQTVAGNTHACALTGGGVRCWGKEAFSEFSAGVLGQAGAAAIIGDDDLPTDYAPVVIDGTVSQLTAGVGVTCALLTSGTLQCWGMPGANGHGILSAHGDEAAVNTRPPLVVTNTQPLLQSTAARYAVVGSEYGAELALVDGDGDDVRLTLETAPSWLSLDSVRGMVHGVPLAGDIAVHSVSVLARDGEFEQRLQFDVKVTAAPLQEQLTVGSRHACAVSADGELRCWGSNEFYQSADSDESVIGDDESIVSGGTIDLGWAPAHISAGGDFTCAASEVGDVRCWGDNTSGATGNGSLEDAVSFADSEAFYLGEPVRGLSCGAGHCCVLLASGRVRCWGSNSSGGLGHPVGSVGDDETGDNAVGPDFDTSVVDQVSAGAGFSCAVVDSTMVVCWGAGNEGQLGNGGTDDIGDDEVVDTSQRISFASSIEQLCTGKNACVLLASGDVMCWGPDWDIGAYGYDAAEAIGDNETASQGTRAELPWPAEAIACGSRHTCALGGDNEILCWGSHIETLWRLGGLEGERFTSVDFGTPIINMAAGRHLLCAQTIAGAIRCAGYYAPAQVLGYRESYDAGARAPAKMAGDLTIE